MTLKVVDVQQAGTYSGSVRLAASALADDASPTFKLTVVARTQTVQFDEAG